MEEKLKKVLDPLKKILQHIPIYIAIYDLKQEKITHSNGAEYGIFGYKTQEFQTTKIPSLINKFVYPEDRLKVKESIEKLKHIKEDEIHHLEFRLADVNGNNIWLYFSAMAFKQADSVTQVLLNGLDISAIKKSENYIGSQLKELQIIEHIGSYDWDITNDVLKYSKDVYEMFDFPLNKKEFNLSDIISLLRPESMSAFEEDLI